MRLVQSEPAHFLVERRAIDAQLIGRCVAVPVIFFQYLEDDLAFGTFESLFECLLTICLGKHQRAGSAGLNEVRRQVIESDARTATQEDGSLDYIL